MTQLFLVCTLIGLTVSPSNTTYFYVKLTMDICCIENYGKYSIFCVCYFKAEYYLLCGFWFLHDTHVYAAEMGRVRKIDTESGSEDSESAPKPVSLQILDSGSVPIYAMLLVHTHFNIIPVHEQQTCKPVN